jgi:hypothetical protein
MVQANTVGGVWQVNFPFGELAVTTYLLSGLPPFVSEGSQLAVTCLFWNLAVKFFGALGGAGAMTALSVISADL